MPITSTLLESEVLERRKLTRMVRSKMRDMPELNTLIDGEENSDELIYDAIDITLSRVNTVPPRLGVFLARNTPLHILMDGVIFELLESAAILLTRNYLQFSTGGFTVDPPQYGLYQSMADKYWQRFRSEIQQYKVSLNHQLAVDGSGGIFSDWLIVNRPTRFYFNDLLSGSLIDQ